MNARRFACLFLGAWLAATAAVNLLISLNHHSTDTILSQFSPAAAAQVRAAGPAQARALFSLQTSELNRLYREYWGTIQIVAGAGFLFFLLFGTREHKTALAATGAVLLVVILQRTLLVPEISDLTRLMHSEPGADTRRRLFAMLWTDHGVEALKFLIGGVAALRLVREGRHRLRHPGKNVDMVDKPDYRHINR